MEGANGLGRLLQGIRPKGVVAVTASQTTLTDIVGIRPILAATIIGHARRHRSCCVTVLPALGWWPSRMQTEGWQPPGVSPMSARAGRDWMALFWVALSATILVTAFAIFVTLGWLIQLASPLLTLLVLLPPIMGVGLAVGAAAGIGRWWLVVPAMSALLGAVAAVALVAALGFLPILGAPPGIVAGSLLAVVVVDPLTHRCRDAGARRRAPERRSASDRP